MAARTLPAVTAAGLLTDELWSTAIADVHAAILEHPFVRGLVDGSLDEGAFRHYVEQDAHYLRDYARALAVCAARAPDEATIAMFSEHAAGAIAVEHELHREFLAGWGADEAALAAVPVAPTTRAYTSYLLATAHGGSFAEALGAVLPCYWIYERVGSALLDGGSPNRLYRRWIETYGGEEFGAIVASVLALVDRLGPTLSPTDRERMRGHVRATARYEWMFWDAALRREAWPL
jgi:thiaminase/transcriptional activator TenA